MNPTKGTVLGGRYTLTQRIAVGGMGEVWASTDTILGRSVAVKLLHPGLSTEGDFVERFRAEARHTASLHHPNIATVFDFGEDEGTAYLVMELVLGQPLSQVIAERAPLSAPETAAIMAQAATALEAAHQGGVIHRDVKPANILITPEGTAKLTDFGISLALASAPLTQIGEVLGTAQYLSPEQALGQSATTASDIYSLGVVGYEMLTGQRPFDSATVAATALAHVNQPPPPLPDTVPAGIRDVINASLAKDPAARPASAVAVAHALGMPGAALASDADFALGVGTAALPSADLPSAGKPDDAKPAEASGSATTQAMPALTQAMPALTRAMPIQAPSTSPSGTRGPRRPPAWLMTAAAAATVLFVLAVVALALASDNDGTRTPDTTTGSSATATPSATSATVVAPPVTSSVPNQPSPGKGKGKGKGKS